LAPQQNRGKPSDPTWIGTLSVFNGRAATLEHLTIN